MKKTILVLLFIAILAKGVSADINYAVEPGATSTVDLLSSSGSVMETCARFGDGTTNINDDDEVTACGWRILSGGGSVEMRGAVYFAETASEITNIEYVINSRGTSGTHTVELYYSGSWHNIPTTTYLSGATTINIEGSWSDVSAVRLTMDLTGTTTVTALIYELRAFGPEPSATDINFAASANGGVASETGTTQGTPSGAIVNTNDGDTTTYWKREGYWNNANPPDRTYGEFTIEIIFDETVTTLNTVNYWIGWYNQPIAFGNQELSCSVYYSGEWHEIGTSTSSPISIDGPWYNVEKVRVHMNTWTQAYVGDLDMWAGATLYELEAWGPPEPILYQDIGLRVFDGTGISSIAVELLGTLTSPLRIAKNGVTYGIVLVDPSDPDASGIRIQTSSGVKALRKYT